MIFINFSRIKENKDGSFDVTVSYNDDFKKFVCNYKKKKRCSKKLIEETINEGLRNYIEEENDDREKIRCSKNEQKGKKREI